MAKVKILCLLPGGLGDQIICLPAVRYLRSILPSAGIELRIAAWRTRREFFGLVLGASVAIKSLDELAQPSNVNSSRPKYDWILDFDTTDGRFLSHLRPPPHAVQKFFTFDKVQRSPNQVSWERHDILHSPFWQRCFDMAFCAACAILGRTYSREAMLAFADHYRIVSLPPATVPLRRRVRRLLSGGKGRRRLSVAPGGRNPKHKLWPIERFGEVIRYALSLGTDVFVVGTAEEADLGSRILNFLRPSFNKWSEKGWGSLTFLMGCLTLEELAYFLREMNAHLTNDNGAAHLGGLLGLPQLILYRGVESFHHSIGFRDVSLFSGDDSDLTGISTRRVIERLDRVLDVSGEMAG